MKILAKAWLWLIVLAGGAIVVHALTTDRDLLVAAAALAIIAAFMAVTVAAALKVTE